MSLCVSIFKESAEECVTIVISTGWIKVTFIFLIIHLFNVGIFLQCCMFFSGNQIKIF